MQPGLELAFADGISGIWSTLHSGTELVVSEDEVHYLRMQALTLDDDLVSHLILKKLRLCRVVAGHAVPSQTVAMNSLVEFTFDGGDKQCRQLVHPTAQPSSYGLSVTSLLGAGVLGLRTGQSILWPTREGSLCNLHVARVESALRRSPRDASAALFRPRARIRRPRAITRP